MSRRALITGASGFVGTRLCAHLKAQGWQVDGCDAHAGTEVRACDLRNAGSVDTMLAGVETPTHVFHLAAMTFVPEANNNPSGVMEVNLLGTIHLAEAMRRHMPAARLVFVGSADAYGPPHELPVTEDHPLNPGNPYAISKAAADHYCAFLSKAKRLDVIRLRPFNHSGPGQKGDFALTRFARESAAIALGQQEPEIQVGNLEVARDFSHVDDIIRGYEMAALHGHSGAVYNLCSGTPTVLGDALNHLVQRTGQEVNKVENPDFMRPVDVLEVAGSHARITEDTGWTPAHSTTALLDDLYDYWHAELSKAGASADAR